MSIEQFGNGIRSAFDDALLPFENLPSMGGDCGSEPAVLIGACVQGCDSADSRVRLDPFFVTHVGEDMGAAGCYGEVAR